MGEKGLFARARPDLCIISRFSPHPGSLPKGEGIMIVSALIYINSIPDESPELERRPGRRELFI